MNLLVKYYTKEVTPLVKGGRNYSSYKDSNHILFYKDSNPILNYIYKEGVLQASADTPLPHILM